MNRMLPYLIFAGVCAGFLALALSAKAVWGAPVPAAVQRWLPDVERHIVAIWGDDRWVALHGAVLWQESSGRPDARSHANAQGLLQIMPRTFAELRSQFPGHGSDRRDPQTSMALGFRYMQRVHSMFSGEPDLCERWRKTWAGYNAGPYGTAKRVQRHGSAWADHLPRETQRYIIEIPHKADILRADQWPGRAVCFS